jgi:hypothetical protein
LLCAPRDLGVQNKKTKPASHKGRQVRKKRTSPIPLAINSRFHAERRLTDSHLEQWHTHANGDNLKAETGRKQRGGWLFGPATLGSDFIGSSNR